MRNIFLFLVFVYPIFSFSQFTQLGQDIDGESLGDQSGYSVSLSADGNRVAIGAQLNDGNGIDSGHVRIYEYDGSSWSQLGSDIDGEAVIDQSGWSVSLSADGNRVAIGARFNNGNGSNSGHVRMFEFDGSNWSQLGSDIDGEALDDQSGHSVSLSADGNRVAIGAYLNDGNGANSGHVRIYDFDGSNWVQLGADIDGETIIDQSGWSVSLSDNGNRVAISSQLNDDSGVNAGHVRIFEFDGSSWSQLGSDIDGESAEDLSGYSVSLNAIGNRVAIGAYGNDGNGLSSGHVRIYEFDGSNWLQLGSDINGEAAVDRSGWSLSLNDDGNRVAIGAYLNDGSAVNSGHTRVFRFFNNGWEQLGDDIDGEASFDSQSGWSVSLSADGNRVAIGAYLNDGSAVNAGHVRIYEFDDSTLSINDFNEDLILIYPNPTNDTFLIFNSENNIESVKIYNINGKLLNTFIANEQYRISHLSKGIYIVLVTTTKTTKAVKLIIK